MASPHSPVLPGILRLAPATRRRIYLDAGMGPYECYGHVEPILYNLSEKHYIKSADTLLRLERNRKGFHGLLVCCRTIHDEAAALLYSSNWFMIRYETTASLAPLRALTPVAIASLTNLRIVLNQSSCHCRPSEEGEFDWGCCDRRGVSDIYYRLSDADEGWWSCWDKHCRGHHKDKHSSPLRSTDPSASAMLAEWHTTAAYLACHASPGNLELSFVCDVHEEDLEAANQAVDALNLFPRLKDCHVRLSRTRDSQLRELAQDAVLRARRITPDQPLSRSTPASEHARLVSLPEELRLRILEYTDLITPMKEVIWASSHGKYLASRKFCLSWEGRDDCDDSDSHHACQFICCSMRAWPKQSIGCFCYIKHAAYSSTCRCWAPPTPLFLICRTLHEDANRLFFSQNRFVLMEGEASNVFDDWGEPLRASHFQHSRFAATQFLREAVPVRCLGHLRSLELVFPGQMPDGWLQAGRPMANDWSETIDWVKDKIKAPALTVRLVGLLGWKIDDPDTAAVTPTGAQAKEAMDAYLGIIKPLTQLGGAGGLAMFYADIAWPWRWPEPEWSSYPNWEVERSESDLWSRRRKQWLKETAERLVLGTRYDSLCPGAAEPDRGWWQSIFARDC